MFLRHTFGPSADRVAGGVLMASALILFAAVLLTEYANSRKFNDYKYNMQKVKMIGLASIMIFFMGAILLICNL